MDSFLIKIKTPFYDPFSPIEWHFSPSSKQTPSNFNLIKIEFMTSPILYDWILSPWYGDLQIQKTKKSCLFFSTYTSGWITGSFKRWEKTFQTMLFFLCWYALYKNKNLLFLIVRVGEWFKSLIQEFKKRFCFDRKKLSHSDCFQNPVFVWPRFCLMLINHEIWFWWITALIYQENFFIFERLLDNKQP